MPRLVARTPAPVHTKLLGAFFAIVALLIIFGVVVLQVLNGVNRRAEDLIKLQRKSAAYRQLQHDTTGQLYSVTTALLAPDERLLQSSLRQLHQFRYDLERVEFVSRDEVELFGRIKEEHEKLITIVTKVVELTRAGEVADALQLRLTQAVPLSDRLERLTNEMVNRAEAEMVAQTDESMDAYRTSRWVVIGFAMGSIGLALLLGYAISRSLMDPVKTIEKRLMKIASGDFSKRIEVPNKDELGVLAQHLNRMSKELEGLYQQIETTSQHKSAFLANISHELRTPLNAIIGYSEMLMEDAKGAGQSDLIPDLQKIWSSGKHLLSLINDILDLSKIEAGKMEILAEKFDIESIVEEVANTVRPLAEKNGNKLEIQCADNIGTMNTDMTKVRQTLFNLLSNACKFTERGTIRLEAACDTVEAIDWLTLRITDTGIGMTEEQISRIFQPFSQAETRTTKKYGGTGLGLAITRQFCEMMGGEVTVKSKYGKGTTFSVRLPMKMNEPEAGAMPSAQSGNY